MIGYLPGKSKARIQGKTAINLEIQITSRIKIEAGRLLKAIKIVRESKIDKGIILMTSPRKSRLQGPRRIHPNLHRTELMITLSPTSLFHRVTPFLPQGEKKESNTK